MPMASSCSATTRRAQHSAARPLVNTTTTGDQNGNEIAMLDDGSFLVTWNHTPSLGAQVDIYGQRFAADGTPIGSETLMLATRSEFGGGATLATNGTGTFVTAARGRSGANTSEILTQTFGTEGLTYTTGDGITDSTITVRGTQAQLNGLLDGMIYTPNPGFNGVDTLTITTDDLGNTGSGGSLQDIDNVQITVGNLNAPMVNLDADDSSGAGGNDFAAGWTEDGGPVLVADTDATLADSDENLTGLTVTITNLLDGTDEVLAADTSGDLDRRQLRLGDGCIDPLGRGHGGQLSTGPADGRLRQRQRRARHDRAGHHVHADRRDLEWQHCHHHPVDRRGERSAGQRRTWRPGDRSGYGPRLLGRERQRRHALRPGRRGRRRGAHALGGPRDADAPVDLAHRPGGTRPVRSPSRSWGTTGIRPISPTRRDGSSVAVWQQDDGGGLQQIVFQRYDASGAPIGPETVVDTGIDVTYATASLAVPRRRIVRRDLDGHRRRWWLAGHLRSALRRFRLAAGRNLPSELHQLRGAARQRDRDGRFRKLHDRLAG